MKEKGKKKGKKKRKPPSDLPRAQQSPKSVTSGMHPIHSPFCDCLAPLFSSFSGSQVSPGRNPRAGQACEHTHTPTPQPQALLLCSNVLPAPNEAGRGREGNHSSLPIPPPIPCQVWLAGYQIHSLQGQTSSGSATSIPSKGSVLLHRSCHSHTLGLSRLFCDKAISQEYPNITPTWWQCSLPAPRASIYQTPLPGCLCL